MTLRRLQLETSWGDLRLVGGSRAGEGTLVLLPQLRLGLDPGRAHRALPPMRTVVLSHGHIDHLGGLGYWASQRYLNSMPPATLIVPEPIEDEIRSLLAAFARLEGGEPYQVAVVGATDGSSQALRRDIELAFFATDHWVPTLGTRIIWHKHRLRSELSHLSEPEIARRRLAGEEVTEDIATTILAYCADSGPGLLETGLNSEKRRSSSSSVRSSGLPIAIAPPATATPISRTSNPISPSSGAGTWCCCTPPGGTGSKRWRRFSMRRSGRTSRASCTT